MAENYFAPSYFAPPSVPLKPYTGTFGKKQLLHLLKRTLFGVGNADLKAFQGKTLEQVVDALLEINPTALPSPPLNLEIERGAYKRDAFGNIVKDANGKNIIEKFAVPAASEPAGFGEPWINSLNVLDGARRASYKAWSLGLMMEQERNIREKMVLFLTNHFSIEADAVGRAHLVYAGNMLLRKYCIGNFKDLIRDITIDASMLIYLNGERNNKAAPDENYARELQELYTLGKGVDSKYTEDDVRAAAKVLTGWVTNRGDLAKPVIYRPTQHDSSDKKFSSFYGNTIIKGDASANGGLNEINALLNMIFKNEEVAKYIVRKLYTFFVYYDITPDIEKNVIAPLADIFRTNNYELKPVLKALFTSDDFYQEKHIGAMIKSPIDHVLGIVKLMEYQLPQEKDLFEVRYFFWQRLFAAANNAGQNFQDPPNVAGWPAYYQTPSFYEIWLDTASYPVRQTTQNQFFSAALSTQFLITGDGTSIVTPAAREFRIKVDYAKWLSGFVNPKNAAMLIDELTELMYGASLSQNVKDKLKNNKLFLKIGNIQLNDTSWSDAVATYMANPATTDATAMTIPNRIHILVNYMMKAAEFHLQ
jgi:hypothetical protein